MFEFMNVLLMFIGLLIVLSICIGVYRYVEIDVEIAVKQWDSPYYQFGISFVQHTLEDGNIEEELSLNMFFFNVNVIFYKFGA